MASRASGQDLIVGTELGHYSIAEKIGAGGMGEVYRARDEHLARDVAIKVLPPGTVVNESARKHFRKEALILSQLNHPSIATIYDFDTQQGVDFLVMEYISGITLNDKVSAGPLPEKELLRLGVQLAEGLCLAHEHGVVHRDLKPGNLRITNDGRLKILDFGLAQLRLPATPTATTIESLSESQPIAGTLNYMAPEQLLGQEIDARTDIHAAGLVLYEMATGRHPFASVERTQLIAAILHRTPRLPVARNEGVSPELERIIGKCAEKEPENRYQSAKELAVDLRRLMRDQQSEHISAEVKQEGSSFIRERTFIVIAVAIVTTLLLGAVWWLARTKTVPDAARITQVVRAVVNAPGKTRFNFLGDTASPMVLSPDGTKLVFPAGGFLWALSLNETEPRRLEGTQDATFPFWSPDSRSLGFSADGKLKTVDMSGGAPVTLCDAPILRGASWGRDGTILFEPGSHTPIYRVAAAGGTPVAVTKLDATKHTTHRWPSFLPDGKHFLYLAAKHEDARDPSTEIYVASLDGHLNRPLVHSFAQAEYASGYLLYLRDTTLMAQPFDLDKLEFTGDAVAVAEKVTCITSTWGAIFSASQNGVLVYQAGEHSNQSELRWYDRKGRNLSVLESGISYGPRLSPDGTSLAVDFGDPDRHIWIFDLHRGVKSRLTFKVSDFAPVWSPDGSRIAFTVLTNGVAAESIFTQKSNGEGQGESIHASPGSVIATDWSPDGRFILLDGNFTTRSEIDVLPLGGNRNPYPFAKSQFPQRSGHFSPDGRWVAYASRESGREEIYVAPFPGPGGKWQVSTSGGKMPRWRKDGRELYFVSEDDMLTVAAVEGHGNNFQVTNVQPLFRVSLAPEALERSGSYDVNADGTRFIVNASSNEIQAPITLVLNWPEELKKK